MIANFISKNLPEEDSFMNSNTPVMNLQFTCGIFWEKVEEQEDFIWLFQEESMTALLLS